MTALVTIEEYNRLMEDRPPKFSAEQVGYMEKAPEGQKEICGLCFHWYQGLAARRNVCEIFRPSLEKTIPLLAVCLFFTKDGKGFPLLEKERSRISTLL